MKQAILTLLSMMLVLATFSQQGRKVSIYISGDYRETLFDRTRPNNPWTVGVSTQVSLNNSSAFKPTVDLSADLLIIGVKVLYIDENGRPLDGIESMVNLFGGVSYHPSQRVYLSVVGGPSLVNGKPFAAIKPSIGFYFSKTQKVTARLSYLNVFNRIGNQDYGGIGVSVGVRIF